MLAGMQGFQGFADLRPQRERLVREMVRNLRGEVIVNNDPCGTAPLRFRLYYSGMAIGVLLDRLAPGWHHDIIVADTSLTALLRDALRPTDTELVAALATARADTGVAMLRAAKTRLAEEGRTRILGKLAALESGPGTRLIVDYSALGTPGVALSFTPFGITVVDSVRTFLRAAADSGHLPGRLPAQGVVRAARAARYPPARDLVPAGQDCHTGGCGAKSRWEHGPGRNAPPGSLSGLRGYTASTRSQLVAFVEVPIAATSTPHWAPLLGATAAETANLS
jgi:hypothetical protein